MRMLDFQLNEDSDIPLWAQLKKRLAFLIATGAYGSGDRLPTVRELSSNLGVAYNTVSKVYRDLERDGLIRTRQGSGTFVTYSSQDKASQPDAQIEGMVAQLVEKTREVGMTSDELIELVETYLERIG